MLARKGMVRKPLRPRDIALAVVEDRFHQGIAPGHDVADHPDVGADDQLLLAEAFGELDAERAQLIAHRRVHVRVAARDAVAGRLGDGGDAAHESAADAEDMEVCAHWTGPDEGRILCDLLGYIQC